MTEPGHYLHDTVLTLGLDLEMVDLVDEVEVVAALMLALSIVARRPPRGQSPTCDKLIDAIRAAIRSIDISDVTAAQRRLADWTATAFHPERN